MKKYILYPFLILMFHCVYSQEYLPDRKHGTRLEYLFDLHGQKRMIPIVTKMSSDSLIMEWDLSGIKGNYIISPQAIENGDRMSFTQGVPFQSVVLAPDETFCMISRAAFQDLVQKRRFVYNQTTYVLDEVETDDKLLLNGGSLDVLHVTAQIDATEMWILNNPDFPVIGKMIKNPLGINFELTSISSEYE